MFNKVSIAFSILCASTMFLCIDVNPVAAQFTWGNSSDASSPATDQLRSMEKQVNSISKNIQFYLQANGRWLPSPQGKDLAFWVQLDALKNQIKQTRRTAENSDGKKLASQLAQLQVVAQNTTTLAQQGGFDAATIGQLQMIQNGVNQAIMLAQSSPYTPNNNNNGGRWNPYYPNNGGAPLTLLNAQLISADQATVSWSLPSGGTATYITKLNSYMLSDGTSLRAASPSERILLQSVYAQVGGMMPVPIGGGGTGYHPGWSTPAGLQASASGKGQFLMMGQNFMNIRNASVQCDDPVGRRGTFSIFGGRESMNFVGTVRTQNQSAFSFNIDGSDRGAASGSLSCTVGFDGRLVTAQGNGMLNGQSFVIAFKGN
jgi:hypothetical protein